MIDEKTNEAQLTIGKFFSFLFPLIILIPPLIIEGRKTCY